MVRKLIYLSMMIALLAASPISALAQPLTPPEEAPQQAGAAMAPMTTLTVNTDVDENDGSCSDGDCSLRDAIAVASPGDTIVFAGDYAIYLNSTLSINKALTIDGSGHTITISGDTNNDGSRNVQVLNVNTTVGATIIHINIVNGSSEQGAGIHNAQDSALTLLNCTVANNAGTYGSGIMNMGSLIVSNSTIAYNAAFSGGGIYNQMSGAQLVITNSTFVGNSASSSNAYYGGGAVYNWGPLTIDNSTFTNNSASAGGAIMNNLYPNVVINNSTFSGNHANGAGDYGGGAIVMMANSGTMTMRNCTVTGNTTASNGVSGYSGGGISATSGTSVTLINTIVAGNSSAAGTPDLNGAFTSGGYNLVGSVDGSSGIVDGVNGDIAGSNAAPMNPRLAPLNNYGGDTLTHALLFDSPAIDAVPPANCTLTTDQRGVSRPFPIGGNCDIGAVEWYCDDAITVQNANDSGAGSLRQAIAEICPGGVIDFADDYTIALSSTLDILTPLAIDGSSHAVTVDGNDMVRVFTVYTDTHVTIDSLTIAHGRNSTPDLYSFYSVGGGMKIEPGAVVTLTHSAVLSNTASYYYSDWGWYLGIGGGIFNQGTLTAIETTFAGNAAGNIDVFGDSYGGAIENMGTLTVDSSTFTGNEAGMGGAINSEMTTTLTVQNSLFTGNSAPCGGAGISSAGTATVSNSTISNNIAPDEWCEGDAAGIGNRFGTMTIAHSVISGNVSEGYYGGLSNYLGTLTVIDSAIYNNVADDYGGGIYNWYNATLTVINSEVYSNTAGMYGGGILSGYGAVSLTVINSAIYSNTAGSYGGGIFNGSQYDGGAVLTMTNSTVVGNMALMGGGIYNKDATPTLSNSILWGNDASTGAQIYNTTALGPTIRYSDIEGSGGSGIGWDTSLGTDGGGNIDDDPLFVDAAGANLRLADDSPAIDAADNAAVPADTYDLDDDGNTSEPLPYDLDGTPRFQDNITPDTGSGTAPIVDMGVYEHPTTPPTISSIADQIIAEDTHTGAIPFTVGDLETIPLSLTVSAASGNPALVPLSSISLAGAGENRTVIITPTADLNGSAVITLTVSDGSASTSESFTLTVTPVNDAPGISEIGDQSTPEDTPTSAIPFIVSDIDNPPAALALSAASSNPGLVPLASIVFGGAGADRTVTITPATDMHGTAVITLTASDGELTAMDSFTLTVIPVNDAPMADDQAISTDEETPYSGVLTASDVDSASLSFGLGTAPAHGLVSIALDGSFTYTPTLDYNGADVFTFTVTDSSLSDLGSVDITVNPVNDAPVVQIVSAGEAIEGMPVLFQGAYSDVGLRAALADTITWHFGDDAAAAGVLTPTHTYADNGIYTVTLTVTDTLGGVGQDTLLVTVENAAPVLTSISDQQVVAGAPLTITATYSDAGTADTHTTLIDFGDGVTQTINLAAGLTSFDFSHVFETSETFTVTVTLTDNDGGQDKINFQVTAGHSGYTIFLPAISNKH